MKSVKHEKRLTFLVFKDYFLRKNKKDKNPREKWRSEVQTEIHRKTNTKDF